MWSSSENQPVLCALGLSISADPSLRVVVVWVWVNLWIAKRWVGSWDNHGTLWNSVSVGDWKWLLGEVWNHEHWWAVTKKLLDNSLGVGHRLESVQIQALAAVAISDCQVLGADLVEDIWALGHDLEEIGNGGGSGILGSEQEGEDGLGDLVVGEHAEEWSWLWNIGHVGARILEVVVLLGIEHGENPLIHDASRLGTSGHADLGLSSALGELGQNHVGSLLSVPGIGEWDDNWEVDELESLSNHVVVVGNLFDASIGNVVAAESAESNGAGNLAELAHHWNWLSIGILGDLKELLEVLVVDGLLSWKIDLKSLAGEETIEALAEVDVRLAVKEDPVVRSEELVCDVDDAWLDVTWRVEDLARHIAGGGDHNEPTDVSGRAIECMESRVLTCGRRRRKRAVRKPIWRHTSRTLGLQIRERGP